MLHDSESDRIAHKAKIEFFFNVKTPDLAEAATMDRRSLLRHVFSTERMAYKYVHNSVYTMCACMYRMAYKDKRLSINDSQRRRRANQAHTTQACAACSLELIACWGHVGVFWAATTSVTTRTSIIQ